MTTTTPNEKEALANQIDALIMKATLSGEGLQAFTALRQKVGELDTRAKHQESQLFRANHDIRTEQARAERAETSLKKVEAELDALKKREAAIVGLEKSAAVSDAKAAAYHDILHTIFKPSVVRETIQTTIAMPPPQQGQYGMQYATTMPVTNVNETTKE